MKRTLGAAMLSVALVMSTVAPAQASEVEGPGFAGEALAKLECTRHHLRYSTTGDVGRGGVRVLHFLLGVGGRLGYTEPGALPALPNSGSRFPVTFDAEDMNSLDIVTDHFALDADSVISHGAFAMIFLSQLGGSCKPTQNGSLPAGPCNPDYDPCLPMVDDMNCSDIGTPVTIRDVANDSYDLDRDGDGAACESSR